VSAEPRESREGAGSWKLFVRIFVSVGLLAYLLWRVELAEVGRLLTRADPLLLVVVVALYLAGQALSALKWRRLATAVGFRANAARFVAYYFIGMFFNAFGFGTVGGDVVRAFYLAGGKGRRGLALNTVIADRVSGLVMLLVVAIAALVAFPQFDLPAAIYWSVIALGGALVAAWSLVPRLLPRLLPRDNRLRRVVERDLAPYWSDVRLLADVAILSVVFHVSQIVVLMLLTRALELDVPASYCFVFGPLVNILAAIPISLNGLGVREGGYVFFLAHIGLSRDSAVAFALAWFAVVMLCGAIGGVVYVAERRARPRDEEEQTGHEVKGSIVR
jgi:uncharacterized membrane protein YbhN (UPF0104 family)